MSLTATFYINESDNRVVTKTITQKKVLSVIFKETDDLKRPVLEMAYDTDLEGSNYCELNGYYYYITDMQYSQQRLQLQLRADLLMTYATQIKNLTAIIARQENKYYPYLQDDRLPIKKYQEVTTINFDNVFDDPEMLLIVNGP